MTLVVQSQQTLENLENLVVDIFCKVPNNGLEKETFHHLQKPFDTPNFHKLYKVAPLQNIYQLELIWSLPPMVSLIFLPTDTYSTRFLQNTYRGPLMACIQIVWSMVS